MLWVSGAGHDASYTNQVCPTAMIFVPSIDGRSHVEVETTRWQDCEAGGNVLLASPLVDGAGKRRRNRCDVCKPQLLDLAGRACACRGEALPQPGQAGTKR